MLSGQVPSRFITMTISGTSLTFLEDDLVTKITMLVTAGTIIVSGSGQFANTAAGGAPIASQPITLPNGTPLTLSGNRPAGPIDNLTIDASAGTVDLVLQQ